MAVEFAHEGVAEIADFVVALALGVEVGTALAAAHGEGSEGVLKDLFEAEEFEYAEIDGRVEAQAALVGADGAVELDAVALVDMDFTLVVGPRNLEENDPFRNDHSFENLFLFVYGIGVENRRQGREDLFGRLEKFFFPGLFGFEAFEDFLHILAHLNIPFYWLI